MKNSSFILKYAALMYAGIAGFFLIMMLFDLEHVTGLRYFNIVIVAGISILLAKAYSKGTNKIPYLDGLMVIFATNMLAVIVSAISLVLYVRFFDPTLVDDLKETMFFAGEITMAKVAGAIFMEGAASSIIVSFAIMQYFKDNREAKKVLEKKKA